MGNIMIRRFEIRLKRSARRAKNLGCAGRPRGNLKQTDIDDLEAVIKEMDLSLDLHDFKQFQAQALIDKVGQFDLSLVTVPTAYTWLIGAADLDSDVEQKGLRMNVSILLDRLAFNPANTAILGSALTIKAFVIAFIDCGETSAKEG